jgi:hypothetical protein
VNLPIIVNTLYVFNVRNDAPGEPAILVTDSCRLTTIGSGELNAIGCGFGAVVQSGGKLSVTNATTTNGIGAADFSTDGSGTKYPGQIHVQRDVT